MIKYSMICVARREPEPVYASSFQRHVIICQSNFLEGGVVEYVHWTVIVNKTLRTFNVLINTFMTNASLCGWWTQLPSSLIKVRSIATPLKTFEGLILRWLTLMSGGCLASLTYLFIAVVPSPTIWCYPNIVWMLPARTNFMSGFFFSSSLTERIPSLFLFLRY